MRVRSLLLPACWFACVAAPTLAQAGWPQVFEPTQVLELRLEMSPADWQTVQDDTTFSVEVPAQFSEAGQAGPPMLVSVRRKSSEALQNGTPFKKVALKIDINEFVSGQEWRGLNKLSLENGGGCDVVSEGIAWQLNRLASGNEGYGYEHPAALAAWVTLTINGTPTGVYLSVEQRDKRMLENRGLYTQGLTWFYEVEDPRQLQIEVGSGDSPAVTQLCYLPFEPGAGGACPTPPQATMASQLEQLVEMRSMLTLAAVDAFAGNPDGIFSHAKNFFFADFHPALNRKRMYYPWDLDAVLGGNAGNIYGQSSAYSVILTIPQFRAQYSQIMNNLLCGPLSAANLTVLLDSIEPALAAHLDADPNRIFSGSAAGHFDDRRAWLAQRVAAVRAQIEGSPACPSVCHANCDNSTTQPVLNVADFTCFLQRFAAGESYANCDGSTQSPVLNVADFTCFLQRFAAGCP
jgi:hypothetical protein